MVLDVSWTVLLTGALALLLGGYFLSLLTLHKRTQGRHVSERAIEKSQYRAIFENSQDAIIATNLSGEITDWNNSAETTFGYQRQDVLGKSTKEVFLTEFNLREEQDIRNCLFENGSMKPFKAVRRHCNGALVDVLVSASPIRNEEGVIVGISEIIRDNTEQKQFAEQLESLNRSLEAQIAERTSELRSSYRLREAILNTSKTLIIATDAEGIITHFNPAAEALLGYRKDEIVGKQSPKIFHIEEEVVARAKALSKELNIDLAPGFDVFVIKTKLGMKNESEWTYVTRSGERVPVYLSASAFYDDRGEITGYLGTITDISDLMRGKKKLEALKDQLEKASEIANVGVWGWDVKTNEIHWNSKMYDIYEIASDTTIDFDSWASMIVEEDRERALSHFDQFIKEQSHADIQFDIISASGQRKTIHSTATLDHTSFDQSISVIGINKDISEQLRYEQALKDAKIASDLANKTKSEFVANMSHEIRTPMNAVIGLLELLQRTELNSVQSEYVAKSSSAAKSLLHILNDILDFSKVEAGKLEIVPHSFSLASLVKNLTTVLEANLSRQSVQFSIELDAKLPNFITLDAFRLQQIIVNLAGNALKFTHQGSVIVKLQPHLSEPNRLLLIVADTGIGIAEEHQQHIFEAFVQAQASTVREYGGTGLGLVITNRLIELMGGSITLQSTENVGTTFTVDLPYDVSSTAESLVEEGSCAAQKQQGLQNLQILLVEDNLTNQIVARETLKAEGAIVSVAKNGLEAVELCLKNSFDVVLMDIQMPVMDGYTAAKKIREHQTDIPVIAMTANAMPEDKRQAYQAGMNDHISKPFNVSDLITTIRRYCYCGKN